MRTRFRRAMLGLAMLAWVSAAQGQPLVDDGSDATGFGYGPGMMGFGYGPGMMGYGYGPGMMGGYGPGTMGGYGPGMMGHGYRSGRDLQRDLALTDDQRKKVEAIHDEVAQTRWDIMGKMRTEMRTMRALVDAQPRDRAAIDASFKRMSDLRQQQFGLMLGTQDRIDAILTPEQRAKLRRAYD